MFHRTIALIAAILMMPATAPAWSPLVDPADLVRLMEEVDPAVIDIQSPDAYAEGHVPGAVNAPYPAWRGPKDNPGAVISDARLTLLLAEAGIAPDRPVVITYRGDGSLDFGSAARVYWTLKSAGVERIAILNGGLAAWREDGRAASTVEASDFPSDEQFSFAPDWRIDRRGVEAVIEGRRDAILVDARPDTFFRGAEKHPLAGWAGTLADAVGLPHTVFFDGNRLEVDRDAALEAARASGWTEGGPEVVSFCNTGHWAATNWFVLSEIAGIEGVRLYPESLVGWTRAFPQG